MKLEDYNEMVAEVVPEILNYCTSPDEGTDAIAVGLIGAALLYQMLDAEKIECGLDSAIETLDITYERLLKELKKGVAINV